MERQEPMNDVAIGVCVNIKISNAQGILFEYLIYLYEK